MGVAELMYQHSLHLSEEEAKQALAFVQFLEQRSLATQQDNSVARPWKVGLIGITPDEFHQEIKNSFLNPLMLTVKEFFIFLFITYKTSRSI